MVARVIKTLERFDSVEVDMSLKIKEWEEYKSKHNPKVEEVDPTYFVRVQLGYLTIPFILVIILGFEKVAELIWWLV
jgi:hypothetical protein